MLYPVQPAFLGIVPLSVTIKIVLHPAQPATSFLHPEQPAILPAHALNY
jgi:hypothetical protein